MGGAASLPEEGLAEMGPGEGPEPRAWWDSASCLIDSNLGESLQREFSTLWFDRSDSAAMRAFDASASSYGWCWAARWLVKSWAGGWKRS